MKIGDKVVATIRAVLTGELKDTARLRIGRKLLIVHIRHVRPAGSA